MTAAAAAGLAQLRLQQPGACGNAGFGTDVNQWVRSAHRLPEPTLFVVDLCRAGRAARIAHLTQVPDDELNAWVIAATSPQDPTYEGAFSEAVCEVLEEIAEMAWTPTPRSSSCAGTGW